jgi:hypothetical protein
MSSTRAAWFCTTTARLIFRLGVSSRVDRTLDGRVRIGPGRDRVRALGAQPARFQNDYWHHTTRPRLDEFAKTEGRFDRKSAASGIFVRLQQPYETITPFS